jgi:hypothetical protein
MWKPNNPNPCGRSTGDCVIRALSILLNQPWDQTYIEVCILGFLECDMPNANHVWGKYLTKHGYICDTLPSLSTTVSEFAHNNQNGAFLLHTGEHVVTVIDGDYYDAWDSGNEIPIYVWRQK